MKIVLFGGTTEGRMLSGELAAMGAEVIVCVASEYGRQEQGRMPGVTVHEEPLDAQGMAVILQGADLCIDATHPYASQARENICAAAQKTGIAYRRLARPSSALAQDCVAVDSAREAAACLSKTHGNILLTTGAKELSAFSALGGARLYPRVLPCAQSLSACEAAGIPRRNIIAMQGPFSREMNLALIRQFSIRYLVTKDGGEAGGFAQKVEAAAEGGAVLVVLRRPQDHGESYDAILNDCREILK